MNCAKCPDRVELHPEYRDRDYKDTPCLVCEVRERGDGTVEYNDEVYYKDAVVLNGAPLWIDAWEELTPKQKDIARARMQHPNMQKTELAQLLKMPYRTLKWNWHKIERVFGDFKKRPT